MKKFILALFIIIVSFAKAEEIDTSMLVNDTIIVLNFDSLPQVSYLFGGEENISISRVASYKPQNNEQEIYFMLFIMYSMLLCAVYLNSKTIVSSSFKTLFNMQFAMQFYRAEKKRNTLYYIIYLFFFIIGFSFLLFKSYNAFTPYEITFLKVLLFTILYFVLDYLSSFIYHLFTKNSKAIETVQTSILSFSILLCAFLWPLLAFVIVGAYYVSTIIIIISLLIVAFFLVMRELRVIQILSNEKVDILSFHFFTYLCTFKFLPILILVKVFFN